MTATVRGAALAVLSVLWVTVSLPAQDVPDSIRSIAQVHDTLVTHGEELGEKLWPGFRPDTIRTLYVSPGVGKLYVHRGEDTPEGFRPYPSRPGWAWAGTESVQFPRENVAYGAVQSTEASTMALTVHEALHVYQTASAGDHRGFGRRENALRVVDYPVFDSTNEALLALEGRLLKAAIDAPEEEAAVSRVRDVLEVRSRRRRQLPEEMITFERRTELNEGLAQYVQLRTLMELRDDPGLPWGEEAADAVREQLGRLDDFLASTSRSARLRFYSTGASMGLLLDRLAGEGWKSELMNRDVAVEDVLAEELEARQGSPPVSVSEDDLDRLFARWGPEIRDQASRSVAELAKRREALRDSILSADGLRIRLLPPEGRRFDWCGFDPQNLLTTRSGDRIHARFVNLCLDGEMLAQLTGGAVESEDGSVQFLVPEGAVATTESGTGPLADLLRAGGNARNVVGLALQVEGVKLSVPAARFTPGENGVDVLVQVQTESDSRPKP